MKEHVSLLRLDNKGAVSFIYSDKLKIYVIYHDEEEDILYKFVCDKRWMIEAVHEIETPPEFFDYQSIQWYKPVMTQNADFVYSGVARFEDKSLTFKINDVDVLEFGQVSTKHTFSLLPMDSLQDILVEYHIQKSNRLYAVGVDQNTSEQVYVIVDIAQDKLLRRYTLLSDLGDIVVRTINIDTTDNRVYIGGVVFDSGSDTVVQPYLESFVIP